MTPRLGILLAMLLLVGTATAADNELALLIDPAGDPDFGNVSYDFCGTVDLHLVVLGPYNPTLDRAVENIDGFECRLEFPPEITVLQTVLPPQSVSLMNWPNLVVAGDFPVVGGVADLLTVTVDVPDDLAQFGNVYITPIVPAFHQTIPGGVMIMDRDDGDRIIEATVVSGDFNMPVFQFGRSYDFWPVPPGLPACVVPNADRSWSAVKALYR